MSEKTFLKSLQGALPGMAVTGVTGGMIGSFIGGLFWILLTATVGALIGMVVWRLGGQRFFLFVVIGALLGGVAAILLNGTESGLIGAGAGGAMGGFIAVNLTMLHPRHPRRPS
ncbi:MAG: hypothetical protein HY282_12235 [Nitrospirae bacterium]|nr:hypothetical protein [Candidatus Manganitrophaceae bacterium]